MDKQGKQTKIGTPLFDGLNYAFWNVRMIVYLQAQRADVWKVVVNKYDVPANPPTNSHGKKLEITQRK